MCSRVRLENCLETVLWDVPVVINIVDTIIRYLSYS